MRLAMHDSDDDAWGPLWRGDRCGDDKPSMNDDGSDWDKLSRDFDRHDEAARHEAFFDAFNAVCKDEPEPCNDEPRVKKLIVLDRLPFEYGRGSSSSAAASSSHVPPEQRPDFYEQEADLAWWGSQAPTCDRPRHQTPVEEHDETHNDDNVEHTGVDEPHRPQVWSSKSLTEMPPPSQHDSEEYQQFTPSGETLASAEVPDMERIVYRGFKVAGDAQRSVKSNRSTKSKAQPIGASHHWWHTGRISQITWRIPLPPQPITPQSRTPAGHGRHRVNGVRIPRKRGGQHNLWHTGRIRARYHSRPTETAFLALYTDKKTFCLRDLNRLRDPAEMEKLHEFGEAITFRDGQTGRVCTGTYLLEESVRIAIDNRRRGIDGVDIGSCRFSV